jgi:ribonuclease Z
MSFQVHIIGSGSASPAKGRHHSAQVVKVNQRHYLVDCGEGTQFNLTEQGVNFHKIDAVFISHLHGDHYLGLVGLLSTMGMLGRKKPLLVFSPFGLGELITTHFRISGTILEYPLHLKEFKTTGKELLFEDEEVQVFTFPMPHGVPTQGYLFQEKPSPLRLKKEKLPKEMGIQEMTQLKSGKDVLAENGNVKYAVQDFTHPAEARKSYAYCSDTEFSMSLVEYIKQTDLLYHETTYLEQHKEKAVRNKHSTAQEAAMIAKEAQVGRLAIGHLSSRYDHFEDHMEEARKVFLNTVAAVEGTIFVL